MKAVLPLLALASVALATPAVFRRQDECPPCEYACIASYPEGCYCVNENELRCAKENPCYVPKTSDCPPITESKVASPAAPADEPVCDYVCIQSFPESCYCANENEQKCADTIPGYVPKLQTCPPRTESRDAAPAEAAAAVAAACPACEYACVQSYPQSCYCANAAEQACAKKNPCYKPKTRTCPPVSTMKRTTKYQSCGSRGQAPCPSGTECREDPFASCGFACDQPGYCIPTSAQQCGGFAGFACDNKNDVCVDLPGDDCSPDEGGADCIGYCFTPQK